MLFVLELIALVVFVEGATELICKSLIFSKFREVASSVHPFVADLLKCGYCTSVWVAVPPATLLAFQTGSGWNVLILLTLFTVVLHRLSNYLHNFNDKHLDKFYSQSRKG